MARTQVGPRRTPSAVPIGGVMVARAGRPLARTCAHAGLVGVARTAQRLSYIVLVVCWRSQLKPWFIDKSIYLSIYLSIFHGCLPLVRRVTQMKWNKHKKEKKKGLLKSKQNVQNYTQLLLKRKNKFYPIYSCLLNITQTTQQVRFTCPEAQVLFTKLVIAFDHGPR